MNKCVCRGVFPCARGGASWAGGGSCEKGAGGSQEHRKGWPRLRPGEQRHCWHCPWGARKNRWETHDEGQKLIDICSLTNIRFLCAMMFAGTRGQHVVAVSHWCLCGCVETKWLVSGRCHHFVLISRVCLYVYEANDQSAWYLERMLVGFLPFVAMSCGEILVCVWAYQPANHWIKTTLADGSGEWEEGK